MLCCFDSRGLFLSTFFTGSEAITLWIFMKLSVHISDWPITFFFFVGKWVSSCFNALRRGASERPKESRRLKSGLPWLLFLSSKLVENSGAFTKYCRKTSCLKDGCSYPTWSVLWPFTDSYLVLIVEIQIPIKKIEVASLRYLHRPKSFRT